MTTFLLLLKCFFQSILSTLLRVVLPSVTILLLKYSFKILFTPLPLLTHIQDQRQQKNLKFMGPKIWNAIPHEPSATIQ